MSSAVRSFVPSPPREARLEVLLAELAELTGQRNAIDGRIVDIVAEIDADGLWGNTGCRSVAGLVAWKTGTSSTTAEKITAVARRVGEFGRCVQLLREGQVSVDQLAVIAQRAAAGSDEHYAQLARHASVSQLRTAVKLEPPPEPPPAPAPVTESITRGGDEQFSWWKIKLHHDNAARFEAGLRSHQEALIADWKRDHNITGDTAADDTVGDDDGDTVGDGHGVAGQRAPMPTVVDGFMALVSAGWDAEVAVRPHGAHTTVVVHVDVKDRVAALHLGPALSDSDRRFLTCDATCEVWFERAGRPIGAGRVTRVINRRLRRALEHRHRTCAVPGCGATRGLHAHHIVHWEDRGATELDNLVLVCPYHHRLHHRRGITITGPAHRLKVTNRAGDVLTDASLARPPTTAPPEVAPCHGSSGERADWWWYDPYQPQPPPNPN